MVCLKTQWTMLCDQYFYCYCTESCLHLGTLEVFWATEVSKCAELNPSTENWQELTWLRGVLQASDASRMSTE